MATVEIDIEKVCTVTSSRSDRARLVCLGAALIAATTLGRHGGRSLRTGRVDPGPPHLGAGRGYLTPKQATLGCGSVMHVVKGTETDENAIDASRGSLAAVLVDLADQTGCRDA